MPNLSDPNNWVSVYKDNGIVSGTPSKTNRIPFFRIDMTVRSDYHRIFVNSKSAPTDWWRAGWIAVQVKNQEFDTYYDVHRQELNFRNNTILHYPLEESTPQYSLLFEPVYYLKDVSILVQAYQLSTGG